MAQIDPVTAAPMPDTSSAQTSSAAHEEWFRAQVDQAIAEADRPDAEWVSQEETEAMSLKKRAEWLRMAGSGEKASAGTFAG